MSNANPPVWQQAEEELANMQHSQPQPAGNTLVHTMMLNSLEQGIAFASAHLDQLRTLAAQLRSLIGA